MIEKLLNPETLSEQGFAGGGQTLSSIEKGLFYNRNNCYLFFYKPKIE